MRDDDPADLIHDLFAETLWRGHPLGRPVLGTKETIGGMARDQVKRFYDRHYTPPHLVVAAAGNLRHEELCALVERCMDTGAVVSTSVSPRSRTPGGVPRPSAATHVENRKTEQAHICVGTNGFSRKDAARFAFGVVNVALGGGMSSRLFQEVREKRGLAYSIYSYHSMFAETGVFCVYAGTASPQAQQVLSIIREQLADVTDGGLSEDELERAKGHMKGSLVLSLEDTSGRMSRIGRSEIGGGEILSVDEVLERIDAVTVDTALSAAREVFTRPFALTVVGPFAEEKLAPPTLEEPLIATAS